MDFTFQSRLTLLDWSVIVGFVLFSIAIGVYFSRRGTKDIKQYFASGQGVPWWLLGTSMVATTFAADTPLAISGLVVKQGIWGNWFWWAQVPMFMIAVFFFSRLWRRARILTDTELVSLRYSGTPSKILRGFRALYFALPYNALVMGWVNLSMAKIMALTLNWGKEVAIPVAVLITMSYSAISGLWGVMVTDFFQFLLAIGMAVFLAVISVSAVGGMGTLLDRMQAIYGPDKAGTMLKIVPVGTEDPQNLWVFLLYVGLLWWTVGNTDGGAYLAQRMIAAKDEKHSFLGLLWFNIAHYCLRPWPWIVVGMVAAVQFPGIVNPVTQQPDPELGYIAVMLTYLKPGFLGLMLASFLAAFMSTISTQINWGASYLINDFYRPFIKSDGSNRHYVIVSISATVLIAVLGGGITFFMDDIFGAWLLLSSINAGIGIVYIARWYWWRVNAWSEITAIVGILGTMGILLATDGVAMIVALLFLLGLFLTILIMGLTRRPALWAEHRGAVGVALLAFAISAAVVLWLPLPAKRFPWTIIYTVPISVALWLTVTLLTRPTDESALLEFYRRVQPGGIGWRRIASQLSFGADSSELINRKNVFGALFGIVGVYTTLIGIGKLVLGETLLGLVLFGVTGLCVLLILRLMSSETWGSPGVATVPASAVEVEK
jgi:Na+/proline symporter